MHPTTTPSPAPMHLRDPAAVAAHFRDLALLPHEVLAVAALDPAGRLLCERRLQGHAFGVPATPRDFLPDVLRAGAVAAVLVHNHPSGRLVPSAADLAFTVRFAEAATVCGLRLLDHVILGGGGWLSLRDGGWGRLFAAPPMLHGLEPLAGWTDGREAA